MSKVRICTSVFTAIALVFTSMSLAYAGGGAGFGGGNTYECFVTQDLQKTPDIIRYDDGLGAKTATLGRARLICLKVIPSGTAPFLRGSANPAFDPDQASTDGVLKCYDVSSTKAPNPATTVDVIDPFYTETGLSILGGAQLLCTTAHFGP